MPTWDDVEGKDELYRVKRLSSLANRIQSIYVQVGEQADHTSSALLDEAIVEPE